MWSFGTTMTIASDQTSSQPLQPAQHSQPAATTPMASRHTRSVNARPDTRSPITSQRSLRQLGVFFAGAGFLSLATLITRRSIIKKRIATLPRFYQQSNIHSNKIESDSSFIAFEALNLATLNVLGFGIMLTGGLSWAFDICDIEELRRLARRKLETEGYAHTDKEAEEEIEQYFARVLLRKEEKDRESQAKPSSPASK